MTPEPFFKAPLRFRLAIFPCLLSLGAPAFAQAPAPAAGSQPGAEAAQTPAPPPDDNTLGETESAPSPTTGDAPESADAPAAEDLPKADASNPPDEESENPSSEEALASKEAATTSPPPTDLPKEKQPAPYSGPASLLGHPGEKIHVGGYGGISILGTSINNTGGVLLGAEGALLLDHRFAMGLAAYGLASEVRGDDFANGDGSVLGFGYGGATFRYHLMSQKSPVTFSLGALVGGAGLTLLRKVSAEDFELEEEVHGNGFFVVEPSAQVNLHLTRWMRVGVGGGYRFVRGPDLREISDTDLEGITAGAHVQFGWF